MNTHTWIGNLAYYVVGVLYLIGWGLFCTLLPEKVSWLNTLPLFFYSSLCLGVAVYALRLLKRRYDKLALSDPDTNLYNERFFFSALSLEFNRSSRHGLPLSLVVFSFDNLKETATQLGQSVPKLNKLFIETVASTIRNTDIFSTLEHDKYSLLLPNTDVDGAKVAANRLKVEIETRLKKIRLGQRATVPFGVCGTSQGAASSDELFAGSIQAYSVAQGSPRNKIVSCGEACR